MILADYSRYISDIPKQFLHPDQLNYGHSVIGHYPLGEMTEFRYGDGGDTSVASTRFYSLIHRTGIQIYNSVIPLRQKICGACHEIIGLSCPDAASCDVSKYNPYCCHADNAAVYPYLEWMLYLLLVGKVIGDDTFIQNVAWMRTLSKKLYGVDRMASMRNRKDGVFKKRFNAVFGHEPSLLGVLKKEEMLAQNQDFQRQFSPKIELFIRQIQLFIQQKMKEKWIPRKSLILSEQTLSRVVSTAIDMDKTFWTIDLPSIQ